MRWPGRHVKYTLQMKEPMQLGIPYGNSMDLGSEEEEENPLLMTHAGKN